MVKPLRYCVALALSLTLMACASPSPKKQSTAQLPNWVTELPVQNNWVFGVGSAELESKDDPAVVAKLARNRARLDLMSSLQVSMSGRTDSLLSETLSGGTSEVQKSVNQHLSSKVKVVELEGIQVIESHEDKVNQRVFVLVGLDRNLAARNLRQQMSGYELVITEWQSQAYDLLAQIRELGPVMAAAAQWLELADKHRLVVGRLPDEFTYDTIRQHQQSLAKLLSQLQLAIQVEGVGTAESLAGAIGSRFTEKGMTVNAYDHHLSLEMTVDKSVTEQKGNEYVFLTAQVTLRDTQGVILLQSRESSKGISSLPGKAEEKALNQLADRLADKIIVKLVPVI